MLINAEEELLKQIDSMGTKVIIYGAGENGRILLKRIVAWNLFYGGKITVECFAVTNQKGNPRCMSGIPVNSIENLLSYKDTHLVLIGVHEALRREIVDKLRQLCFKNFFVLTNDIICEMKMSVSQNIVPKGYDDVDCYKLFHKKNLEMQVIADFLRPNTREECFDRQFINSYVKENSDKIKGNILEFYGGNLYSSVYALEPITLKTMTYIGHKDINPGVDYYSDLENMNTLPEEKFDCIVATQVLMYNFDIEKAMKSLKWMLKPGGYLILTVPGPIFHHSRGTRETYLFTAESLEWLCSNVFGKENISKIEGYGNFEYAQYCMFWMRAPSPEISNMDYEDRFALVFGCTCRNGYK